MPRFEDDEPPIGGDAPTLDAVDGSVSRRSGDASGAPAVLTGSIGRFQISYLVMRPEDDGSYRVLWSNERTWVVRPHASPSGRHVALEGLTFHADVVTLELGSLGDEPPSPASRADVSRASP